VLPTCGLLALVLCSGGVISLLLWRVGFDCRDSSLRSRHGSVMLFVQRACMVVVLWSLGCLILPMLILVALQIGFIVLFPILAQQGWYHMERNIMLCLPLPVGGPEVAISASVSFAYSLRFLHSLLAIGRRWEDPDELDLGAMKVYHRWALLQFVDLYTGAASLLCLRAWPAFLWIFWLLSVLVGAGLVATILVFRRQVADLFLPFLAMQLLCKDLPQLLLVLLANCLRSKQLGFDQYVLYSALGSALSIVNLVRKLWTAPHFHRLFEESAQDEEALLEPGRGNREPSVRPIALLQRRTTNDSRTVSRAQR